MRCNVSHLGVFVLFCVDVQLAIKTVALCRVMCGFVGCDDVGYYSYTNINVSTARML